MVPGSHTKAYQRRKASKSAGTGLAGAFSQLLEGQPKLEALIRQLITSHDVRLVQKGEHVYLKNLRNAHNRFTAACRSLGWTGGDYPLNQEQRGLRSLGAAQHSGKRELEYTFLYRACLLGRNYGLDESVP